MMQKNIWCFYSRTTDWKIKNQKKNSAGDEWIIKLIMIIHRSKVLKKVLIGKSLRRELRICYKKVARV